MSFNPVRIIILIAVSLFCLGAMFPMLSLTIRRMRDTQIAWWILVAIIIIIPVFGLVIVGVLQKPKNKFGIVSKIGYTLIVIGFGIPLWGTFISFLSSTETFNIIGMIGLSILVVGIIVAYIGVRFIDKVPGLDDDF